MRSIKLLIILLLFYNIGFAQFDVQQIITVEALNPGDVYAADLDGDGDIDVLSASEGDEKIAWYKNLDGLGSFSTEIIITNNLEDVVKVIASDLDGDGDLDVLGAAKQDDVIVWYKNLDGLGTFGQEQVITDLTDGALSVFTADLDGDGDLDVLSASFVDEKVAWYENLDGLGSFGEQQIITSSAISVRSVYAADLDGDGDIDVMCDGSNIGIGTSSWYENLDGLGNFGPQQEIASDSFPQYTIAADLDGDGDMDIINDEFGSGKISWYQNTDGLGNFGSRQIVSSLIKPVKIYAADVDNDGDIDVLSVTHDDSGGGVYWHENIDGLGTFSEKQIISTNIEGGRGVFAADLDGDGDMDALSASIVDYKIAWYENLTILGIEDNNISGFSIYPNPTRTIFNINSNNIEIKKIEIYDVLGKKVWVTIENNTQIDISSLDNGLYIVNIQTKQGVLVKKVVKE